jgi:hypothetical protein
LQIWHCKDTQSHSDCVSIGFVCENFGFFDFTLILCGQTWQQRDFGIWQ